jgi:hypothetical protein
MSRLILFRLFFFPDVARKSSLLALVTKQENATDFPGLASGSNAPENIA